MSFDSDRNTDKSDRSAVFKQLISRCPLCEKSVENHSLSLVSSVILPVDKSGKSANLEQLISNRQWSDIFCIKEGRYDADMEQYYLFRCPESGLALLKFIFTYELWSDDWLDSVVMLRHEDILELERLVGNNWLVL